MSALRYILSREALATVPSRRHCSSGINKKYHQDS